MLTRLFFVLVLLSSCLQVLAQDNSNFTHYFMNPYMINPSYAGTDGRASLSLTYRKQWINIEGAPTIANFSFHTPTGKRVGFGLNVTNAERSVLNTTSAYITTSYGLWFSDEVGLRFGVSAGAAYNGVNADEIDNINDPAIGSILDKNLYLIGNAGLSLQVHYFNLGVSIPNIFNDEYTAQKDFTQGEIQPLENLVIFASNRFHLDKQGKFIFEPFVVYRYSDVLPPQIEATGVFHINNLVWLGGTYKQDFGISAFGGLKINKLFGVGYAYSLMNTGANEIPSATHEIHLNLLLGIKNKKRLVYSFVDTSFPEKESKKELAAAKKKAEAEERKRLQEQAEAERKAEAARKKAEEAKQEQERQERIAAEQKATEEAAERESEQQQPTVEAEPQEQEPELIQEEQKGNLNDRYSTEERVIVKHGNHLLELNEGEYVVVGVFSSYEAAEKFSDELFFKGYKSKFGYITQKGFWYVYVDKSNDLEQERIKRDQLRKSKFPNAWVLSVQ